METQNNPTTPYTLTIPVEWIPSVRPGGAPVPTRRTSPTGTLGLTASGRVEVTLDDGKRLFSAPVVLTKRRYEPLALRTTLVVGPRVYALILRTEGVGTSQFTAWRRAIEDCAALPADNASILAAATPDSYAVHAKRVRSGFRVRALAVAGGACLYAAVVVVLHMLHASHKVITATIAALVAITTIGVLYSVKLIFASVPPASANELAVGADDTFPAGTLPTGKMNLTVLQYVAVVMLAMAVGLALFFWIVNANNQW